MCDISESNSYGIISGKNSNITGTTNIQNCYYVGTGNMNDNVTLLIIVNLLKTGVIHLQKTRLEHN